MKTTIQTDLPDELVSRARSLIDQGWAGDFDELLADALWLYLESHSSDLTESFIRQDIAWGLRGS